MNEVGRFSDKQRSILDAQTADLRRFGKTLFTSCFETLKVDLEQNLDIEMKTSSHLTIAMKTGQRRSASGQLFWGPSKCSKCKCLLRYVSKSCIFCGQSTAISQWKGRGKLGPAVEAKVLAALKLPKGSTLNVEKNLNARSVEFSPSLTPKKLPLGVNGTEDLNTTMPSVNIEESIMDSQGNNDNLDNFFDVGADQSNPNLPSNNQSSVFGNFKVASSPGRNDRNNVFSTLVGMEGNMNMTEDDKGVDLLSQTLADFGISDSSNDVTSAELPKLKKQVPVDNDNDVQNSDDNSGLNSVLEVIRNSKLSFQSGRKQSKQSSSKPDTTKTAKKYPDEIQSLIDELTIPKYMLSVALALPVRRPSTMSNLLQSNDMLSSENEESAAHCIQEDANNEQKSPENTHGEEEQASNILGVTSEKPPAFTKSNSEDTSIQSFGEFNKDSVEEEVARGSDSAVHTVEKEQDNITFDGETGHVDGLEGADEDMNGDDDWGDFQ